MRVVCSQCESGYTLPRHRLSPGKRVQFSCRHCGERIVVEPPQTAHATEPALTWFVAKPSGGYTRWQQEPLLEAIARGEISGKAMVWQKGQSDWRPISQTALADLVESHQRPGQSSPPQAAQTPEAAAVVGRGEAPSAPDALKGSDKSSAPATSEPASNANREPSREERSQAQPPVSGVTSHEPTLVHIQGDRPEQHEPRVEAAPNTAVATSSEDVATGEGAVGARTTAESPMSRNAPSPDGSALKRRKTRRPITELAADSQRFAPGARPTGTPVDRGAQISSPAADSASWAPATDTYIGPRNPHTFRLGSAGDMQSLVSLADREQQLSKQIRRWQWVALGATAIALLAVTLSVFSWVSMRMDATRLEACESERTTEVER